MKSSNLLWTWGLAWALLALVGACGDSETPSSAGGAGGNGTGGTGAIAGIPGGCVPCSDANVELEGNGCDDNCNALVDEIATCDASLDFDSTNPVDGARAMDVCQGVTDENDWGVLSVAYQLPGGETPPGAQQAAFHLGHGRLSQFGATTTQRRGSLSMLALSTGTARDADHPDFQPRSGFDKGYTSGLPAGFPTDIPACGPLATLNPADGIALDIEFRVPPNATGFAFDHVYFTADYPGLVCSAFSDVFAVLMDPAPPGAIDNSIVTDDAGNPISVNSELIDACGCEAGPPCEAGDLTFACSLGTGLLDGTGYEMGAATGWLTTRVPVIPGSEFTITFVIWDFGDGAFDSTVLIDGFRWLAYDGDLVTVRATP